MWNNNVNQLTLFLDGSPRAAATSSPISKTKHTHNIAVRAMMFSQRMRVTAENKLNCPGFRNEEDRKLSNNMRV